MHIREVLDSVKAVSVVVAPAASCINPCAALQNPKSIDVLRIRSTAAQEDQLLQKQPSLA